MIIYSVVGVKFPEGAKIYHFDPNNVPVEKGDIVMVDTNSGPGIGRIMTEIQNLSQKEVVFPLMKVIENLSKKESEQTEKANNTGSDIPILLLESELSHLTGIPLSFLPRLLEEGIPYYSIGNEIRFLEGEANEWIKKNISDQLRLELSFIDSKGRTLQEYVTSDVISAFLRIQNSKLDTLVKSKQIPYEQVGTKVFYNVQDTLAHFRRVKSKPTPSTTVTENLYNLPPVSNISLYTKKEINKILGKSISKKISVFIVDGSYDWDSKVGTGVVEITKDYNTVGYSNVYSIQSKESIICEYLAIMDAFIIIKNKNIKNAVIFTDQESLVNKIEKITDYFRKNKFTAYKKKFEELYEEVKNYVTIDYIGNLTKGNKNPVYLEAHVLSRKYREQITNIKLKA
jgi:ribonuclease HI